MYKLKYINLIINNYANEASTPLPKTIFLLTSYLLLPSRYILIIFYIYLVTLHKKNKPSHINDILLGNMNTAVKDYHPLWKDTNLNNKYRPYMNGVHPPSWTVPTSDMDDEYMISSPVPLPEKPIKRIVADEIKPLSLSRSYAYDYPKRNEVVQVTIPQSKTKIIESHVDPRNPPKMLVNTENNEGMFVYGTKSSLPLESRFMQKKLKPIESIRKVKKEAEDLLDMIGGNEESTMIYDIKTTNKKDTKPIKEKHIGKRKSKIDIRALHSYQ